MRQLRRRAFKVAAAVSAALALAVVALWVRGYRHVDEAHFPGAGGSYRVASAGGIEFAADEGRAGSRVRFVSRGREDVSDTDPTRFEEVYTDRLGFERWEGQWSYYDPTLGAATTRLPDGRYWGVRLPYWFVLVIFLAVPLDWCSRGCGFGGGPNKGAVQIRGHPG